MKVLDTTFLIDLTRGNKDVLPILKKKEMLLTTQICMFEVIRGLFYRNTAPAKVQEIMSLFEDIRVLPFDDNAVVKSAEISAEQLKKGHPLADSDCMIAGIALSKGIPIIITRNIKHFQEIKGITVESY